MASAPHRAQNRLPANIDAKHEAQVTVASAEPQYAHDAASAVAGAPQPGHRRAGSDIVRYGRRKTANGKSPHVGTTGGLPMEDDTPLTRSLQ